MAKIDILKKLIREELRAVLREELPKILSESKKMEAPKSYKSSILEAKSKAKQIPGTLNTVPPPVPVFSKSTNPLADMLNETAMQLSQNETMYFDTSNVNANGFDIMRNAQGEAEVVQDVNSMLVSARPSSNFDMVQINAVPDFTGLMNKMKERGEI